ncbi:long-chain-fatty-acid--CoA ligase [Chelativorans alearense]|uniref:long-chain-fatty-acid--CoA ligase n=1 Tax=Chelativorans alearense TaxID=2681495 RepID=UPI0013D4106B|nr:long-chain-fatty-acid--CoA ligase [Chelativorans alearense]
MAKTTTTSKTGGEKKTTTRARKTPAAASGNAQQKAAPKRSSTRSAAEKKQAPKTAAKTADTSKKSAKAATSTAANAKTADKAKPASTRSAASKAAASKGSGTSAAPAKTAGARTTARKPAARTAKAAQKPWLKSYPKEIPSEIGDFEHNSLGDMIVASCRSFAERPAFTCMDKTLTFAELEKASRDFAAYLQSKGLKKGARVAIMMPNVLQYPVVMLAALRAGFVVVNVNPLYTPRELEHQLKDAGAEAIVILENFAKTLQAAIGKTEVKHVVVATMGDMMGLKGHIVNFVVRRVKKLVPAWELPGHVPFKTAMKDGAERRFEPADVGIDDIAFLQYTGGTTGVAKGAMLLHRNVLANVMQNEIWLETAYLKRARPEHAVYICALPLYHIYALTVNALMGLKLGAQNVLITNPRDIPAFVKELAKYDFTVFPGLNTLFNALLHNDDFHKLDFKNLILTFGGGMAVQRSVAERWKALTGCMISEGYGLSETSPVATANRFDGDDFTGTIGLPLPSTEVAIRDEDGKDVKTGKVGEVCIRGPQVMGGYWNRPDETKKSMTKDGFFKSGDMGVMDEGGYIKIVDRKKDMINVSGFNVYPNEIEDVVARHPGVREVAAIGVPDEHSGEVPKLFVVRKDSTLTEEDIIDFCRKELTGYKRPKHVEFRSELPKSNVGKILRRELR